MGDQRNYGSAAYRPDTKVPCYKKSNEARCDADAEGGTPRGPLAGPKPRVQRRAEQRYGHETNNQRVGTKRYSGATRTKKITGRGSHAYSCDDRDGTCDAEKRGQGHEFGFCQLPVKRHMGPNAALSGRGPTQHQETPKPVPAVRSNE